MSTRLHAATVRQPLHKLALAVLAALSCAATPAAVTPSGTVSTRLAGSFSGGAGDFLLPGDELWVGLNTAGSLAVNGGSLLRVGALELAQNGGGVVPVTGVSVVTLDGAGSKIELNGAPSGGRLGIAGWGTATFTVSGGATFDGRLNSAMCATSYCGNSIGNTAGSDGALTITGTGSSMSLFKTFNLASGQVNDPLLDGYAYGTPGGSTRASLRVLAGATLTTEGSHAISAGSSGRGALGSETTQATVLIDGAGSVWHVQGSSLDAGGAFMQTATKAGASANLTVSNGGVLWFDGKTGIYNSLNLSRGGGASTMSVTGTGSAINFSGDAGVLQVGASGATGTASLSFTAGASSTGAFYASVGRDGATGTLLVTGATSALTLNGSATAAANGTVTNAILDVGRGGGKGTATVSAGGRINISTQVAAGAPQLSLGRDAGSAGTLNITGAGATVQLTSKSFVPGGGPTEGFNPQVRVGRDFGGTGSLNITAGGQLLMDGQAISTVADSRSNSLLIGGTNDTLNGGTGTALVSGLGSRISLTGIDSYIGIGHGPQSVGTLTLSDQASIDSLVINVGRSGGTGSLIANHATINLSGQQTGNVLAGAALTVGRSGGTGTVSLGNGSVMTLTNLGSSGASVNLGGSAVGPLGTGTLSLSGASQVRLVAASGLASLTVGRDGTGTMQMSGASGVDLGDGKLFIARLAGSTGTLSVSGGSNINAGWVGVGRDTVSGVESNGGTATLIVNDTSMLNASKLVIGTGGLLGGTGIVNASVTNYGRISPGNSPGTLTINGDFDAAAGSQVVLEVQADGSGGFTTDHLIFGAGSAVNLSGLAVQFHFLGTTDPSSFLASGQFGIDSFVAQALAGGGQTSLGAAAFGGVSFAASSDAYAISNFSYSTGTGPSFTATPVPEPSAGLLLLLGLGLGGWRLRRSRAQ